MKTQTALLTYGAQSVGTPVLIASETPRRRWTAAHDHFLGRLPDQVLSTVWKLPVEEISARRTALPVSERKSRKALRWTRAMLADLGRLPDRELAERHGVSVQAICKKRFSLGITAHGTEMAWTPAMRRLVGATARERLGHPAHHPVICALLGKATDRAIAEQLGVTRGCVTSWRMRTSIPSISQSRWTPKVIASLGRASDAAIAAKLGVDPGTVRYQRLKRGIPLTHRRGPDDIVAQFGRIAETTSAERMGRKTEKVRQQRITRGIPRRGEPLTAHAPSPSRTSGPKRARRARGR